MGGHNTGQTVEAEHQNNQLFYPPILKMDNRLRGFFARLYSFSPKLPVCGDGLIPGDETCDDQNTTSYDGCSATCTVESGYTCSTSCSGSNCTIPMQALYRDVTGIHSDFDVNCNSSSLDMVATSLDNVEKPTPTNTAAVNCAANLDQWYTTAISKATELTLFSEGNNIFVNRYGNNGKKWVDADSIEYDGTPVFFPIDEFATDMDQAKILPHYGSISWEWEGDITGTPMDHNFYFSAELTFWFKYGINDDATLDVLGDDDVGVFINGQLAIDLGGVHIPPSGSVTLGSSGEQFGMVDGNVYAIKVFHPERKKEGSSFFISLSDFESAISTCEELVRLSHLLFTFSLFSIKELLFMGACGARKNLTRTQVTK